MHLNDIKVLQSKNTLHYSSLKVTNPFSMRYEISFSYNIHMYMTYKDITQFYVHTKMAESNPDYTKLQINYNQDSCISNQHLHKTLIIT